MSKMNMDQWTKDLLAAPVKKALPVLSFPSIQLMNCTVRVSPGRSTLMTPLESSITMFSLRAPKAQ